MRIGLLDTLAPSQMPFWEAFLNELGSVPVSTAGRAQQRIERVPAQLSLEDTFELGRASLPTEASYVQLAVGRLLELLERSDVLAVPQLERDSDSDSSSPWLSDFASVFARRMSLPTPVTLPVFDTPQALERIALTRGQEWTHNIGVVRKALDRSAPLLRLRHRDPIFERAGTVSVAVLGLSPLLEQPFLLADLPAQLERLNLFGVYSHQLERSKALEYAPRLPLNFALEAERAVAGAMSLLEGKGAVRGLLFPVAENDHVGFALARRLMDKARKPALILPIAPGALEWAALENFAATLSAPRSS